MRNSAILKDCFNRKACPSISKSSIWSKLFQGGLHTRNTKHWSLQGRQEGSGQCCSPSAQGSEPPTHVSLQCIQTWELQSKWDCRKHCTTLPSITVPGKLPMLISKKRDPALNARPRCTYLFRELNSLKPLKQKSVHILGGSLSFQLWLCLFLWAVSTAPKQHFKRFYPGVETELLWETY